MTFTETVSRGMRGNARFFLTLQRPFQQRLRLRQQVDGHPSSINSLQMAYMPNEHGRALQRQSLMVQLPAVAIHQIYHHRTTYPLTSSPQYSRSPRLPVQGYHSIGATFREVTLPKSVGPVAQDTSIVRAVAARTNAQSKPVWRL